MRLPEKPSERKPRPDEPVIASHRKGWEGKGKSLCEAPQRAAFSLLQERCGAVEQVRWC